MTQLYEFKTDKEAIEALIALQNLKSGMIFVMKEGTGKFKHEIWVKEL